MLATVTPAERFGSAVTISLVAALILGVGLPVLRAIGKSSPARRRHGQFVLGWMLAGWLIGGAYGVYLVDNSTHVIGEADTGIAAFGMLLGWAFGMVHGVIMVCVWPRAQGVTVRG